MKVVLIKDVRGIGLRGDIREVKDGYARNLLIPRGMAELATSQVERKNEEQKVKREAEQENYIAKTKKFAEEIKKLKLDFKVKAGEKGEVFGSIAGKDIEDALRKKGMTVTLTDKIHIKELGEHFVELNLGDGIKTKLRVFVEPEVKQARSVTD